MDIADQVASHHQLMAPDSFANMQLFSDCRLGRVPGHCPYSGGSHGLLGALSQGHQQH